MTIATSLPDNVHRPFADAAEGRGIAASFDVETAVERLAAELAATAVERDRAGGHAAHERRLIRDSGLLALTIPTRYGGLGADWPTLYRVVRRLAQVDSALAHVFGFHHLQIASVLLYGNEAQQARLLRRTTVHETFWGNALNPLDDRLRALPVPGGWRLDGVKSFASGALGSDQLMLSAHVAESDGSAGALLIGTVPTRSPGITVNEDWDSFGQRQTDSGTVRFVHTFLTDEDVLQPPGFVPTPRGTLRTLVSQLVMSNLYLGIAIGALDAARRHLLESGRPWLLSGVQQVSDDPFVLHRFGELALLIRPARLSADDAAARLQRAVDAGPLLDAGRRGDVAIAVAEAKVLAHRASIEVSSQLFELTGARSTSARFGLDRFWRNARVHTLHDPVDYKIRDIGRHALTDRVPDPTPYS
ncbi:MAG TPA: acyl-CoA dehydrogenase family protein [Burkholderiaceae bacterium]|nr:acyl-CoA dehydrogenase family protein [Burkholderiaceae bacterium]